MRRGLKPIASRRRLRRLWTRPARLRWAARSLGSEAAIKPWGVILSLVIVAILLFTGWKGWEMVYRHRVAVLGTPEQAKPITPDMRHGGRRDAA